MSVPYDLTIFNYKLLSRKPQILIPDDLHLEEPVVFIANHEQIAGPMMMESYFPIKFRPWIIYKMLFANEIKPYVQETFFMGRLKLKSRVSGFLARMLTPLIDSVMNSTNGIPVYLSQRKIMDTFVKSVEALKANENLLIFPERKGDISPNHQHVYNFKTGFIYLAKLYFRETQKSTTFVPVSINPRTPSLKVGEPVQFDPQNNFNMEKERITSHLMNQIELLYLPNK